MKRGIVMEVDRKRAIVLTKDGGFEKVRLQKGQMVQIGEEILVPAKQEKKKLPFFLPSFSAAAAAVIVFVLFFSGFTPFGNQDTALAAYVSVDINPSLEVGVNRALEVLDYTALNEDGNVLIGDFEKYKYMPLSQFMETVVALSEEQGYLAENKDMLVTATVLLKEKEYAQELSKSLEESVQTVQTKSESAGKDFHVTVLEGDQQKREEAMSNGLSTGKYMVYLGAVEKGNDLTIDQVREMSVTQLNEKVNGKQALKNKDKANNGNDKAKDKAKGNGNGLKDNPSSDKNNPNANAGKKEKDNNGNQKAKNDDEKKMNKDTGTNKDKNKGKDKDKDKSKKKPDKDVGNNRDRVPGLEKKADEKFDELKDNPDFDVDEAVNHIMEESKKGNAVFPLFEQFINLR